MEIFKEQTKKIDKIAKKYGLELLLLFGSAAAGTMRKDSDYDVAYFARKPLNLMEEAKLITDLFPVFRSDKVDLASIRNASPLLQEGIFRNHIVLFCADKRKYYLHKIYSLKKFIEAEPLFKLKSDLLEKHLAEIKL